MALLAQHLPHLINLSANQSNPSVPCPFSFPCWSLADGLHVLASINRLFNQIKLVYISLIGPHQSAQMYSTSMGFTSIYQSICQSAGRSSQSQGLISLHTQKTHVCIHTQRTVLISVSLVSSFRSSLQRRSKVDLDFRVVSHICVHVWRFVFEQVCEREKGQVLELEAMKKMFSQRCLAFVLHAYRCLWDL